MSVSGSAGDVERSMGDKGRYEPDFWVTDVVSSKHGGRREVQKRIARHLAPIKPDVNEANAYVLFDGMPRHVDAAALAHNAVLQFYDRENEYALLNDLTPESYPDGERVEADMRDLLEGKAPRSKYLTNDLTRLTRSHNITLDSLYLQDVGGIPLGTFVEEFSTYREDTWEDDLDGVVKRTLEYPTESRRLTGRADMLVELDDGREVWDTKITWHEPPVARHADQSRIYAWQLDAEPVVDYAVQQERFHPEYNPEQVSDMVLSNLIELGQTVRKARTRQEEVLRDEVSEARIAPRAHETLEEYRVRVHEALPVEQSYAIGEKAVKEALKTV